MDDALISLKIYNLYMDNLKGNAFSLLKAHYLSGVDLTNIKIVECDLKDIFIAFM